MDPAPVLRISSSCLYRCQGNLKIRLNKAFARMGKLGVKIKQRQTFQINKKLAGVLDRSKKLENQETRKQT